MQYELNNVFFTNAVYKQNPDGSLKVSNILVQTKIAGAPDGKFLQVDEMPAFDIPGSTQNKDNESYILSQAQLYVQNTYPNT